MVTEWHQKRLPVFCVARSSTDTLEAETRGMHGSLCSRAATTPARRGSWKARRLVAATKGRSLKHYRSFCCHPVLRASNAVTGANVQAPGWNAPSHAFPAKKRIPVRRQAAVPWWPMACREKIVRVGTAVSLSPCSGMAVVVVNSGSPLFPCPWCCVLTLGCPVAGRPRVVSLLTLLVRGGDSELPGGQSLPTASICFFLSKLFPGTRPPLLCFSLSFWSSSFVVSHSYSVFSEAVPGEHCCWCKTR